MSDRIRNGQKSKADPYPYVSWKTFCEKDSSSIYLDSRSPTMAGGLLAANREYFFEIGGYGKSNSMEFHSFLYFSFHLDEDMEVRRRSSLRLHC